VGWTVTGYVAERMLGFGATGEVWAGRDVATGDRVALKRLRGTAPTAAALRREATVLATVRHPNLLQLRDVCSGTDGIVLVLDLAEGGSFANLLAARGPLPVDDAVALVAPIADALSAVHDAGLIHGDVAPGNLLLDAIGRPLLADLGTARLCGDATGELYGTAGFIDPAVLAGGAATPASDVYALAAVLVQLVTGRPPLVSRRPEPAVFGGVRVGVGVGVGVSVGAAVHAALDPEPARRPSVGQFAAALLAPATGSSAMRADTAMGTATAMGTDTAMTRPVARPAQAVDRPPVRGLRARWRATRVSAVRRPAGRHRGPPRPFVRRMMAGTAVLVLLAAAVVTGLGWARVSGDPVPQTVSAVGPSPEAAFGAEIDRLDAIRSTAFARADPAMLDLVYRRGSPPHRADVAAVAALRRDGASAIGVRHVVLRVVVLSAGPRVARVVVTDRFGAHQVVDRHGVVLRHVAGRGARSTVVDLERGPAGWRITALGEPDAAPPPSAAPTPGSDGRTGTRAR